MQHHFATRDHYDLRLEINGVLTSWAVTRGPSANPRDKRLAVRTEDHPLSYGSFEGEIPKGEYGGGKVILWEYSTYSPLNGDPGQALAKGEIKFEGHGERMRGGWVLVRMKSKEKRENWLLIKERDSFAEDDDSLTARFPGSVNAKAPRRRKADPPPDFQPPQLCESATAPPEGPDWLYEIKYDGYRLELAVGGEAAKLYTRSGLDWTAKFSGLAAEAARLKCRSALIDGEAVVFDAKGLSDFPGLVAALESHRPASVVYIAFDLLALDGKDLRSRPLEERKAALKTLIGGDGAHIRYAEHFEGGGRAIFDGAVAAGAEGVIAKDRKAPYVGRRSHAFVKVKGYPRTDVIIVAYKPSERMSTFASLHAAVEENGEWRYVGGIGTGFTDAQRGALHARFAAGASKKRPERLKGEVPSGLMFVKSPARAEIRFGGWTGTGHLRQARFLALREDMPMAPAPKPARPRAAPKKAPAITHADRVVYPDCGVTKGEIAEYYAAVAERLAPHLEGRPLSLVRAPETIAETFFQRHPLKGMTAGVAPVEIGDETYMTLDGATGLATAAQFGAIELHGWMSRLGALRQPRPHGVRPRSRRGAPVRRGGARRAGHRQGAGRIGSALVADAVGRQGRACRAAARRNRRLPADGSLRQRLRAGAGGARPRPLRGDDEQAAPQRPYFRRLAAKQEILDGGAAVVAARPPRRQSGDASELGRTGQDESGGGVRHQVGAEAQGSVEGVLHHPAERAEGGGHRGLGASRKCDST